MKKVERTPIRIVDERLTIDSVSTKMLTKQELLDAINKAFPDDFTTPTSKIAVLTETKMRNGEINQTVTVGSYLKT